ncbi:hypothetical protein [Tabrizicola sp.]|uniref:hypothetical protein n=1 Tax=Tabrizicola sp. TaxID=2005166 RepID=UPI00286D3E3B|nr:hypothetical protein [Tabrizicola sp.]
MRQLLAVGLMLADRRTIDCVVKTGTSNSKRVGRNPADCQFCCIGGTVLEALVVARGATELPSAIVSLSLVLSLFY